MEKNNTLKTFGEGRQSKQNIDSSSRPGMLHSIKKKIKLYIILIYVYCF